VLPSLLFLVVLQSAPAIQPTAAGCQDVQRIELSLERGSPREICVSPGLLTGFVFDARVTMDLQDEVRFDVTRGTTSFSLMPPGDAVAGEQFRLTARFLDGASAVFVLRVHRGRATRQVEVFHDKRTRESYQHEVAQAEARIQQLEQDNEALRLQFEHLRLECGDPRGMRRLIASRSMGKAGIPAKELSRKTIERSAGVLAVKRGIMYRSDNLVAAEVWLSNPSAEPWTVVTATLVDSKGIPLKGIQLWQDGEFIAPGKTRLVVVEADAGPGEAHGEVTLTLREDGPRGITIPKVALP
jgi:uncharacterized protein (TIGR02268 family)